MVGRNQVDGYKNVCTVVPCAKVLGMSCGCTLKLGAWSHARSVPDFFEVVLATLHQSVPQQGGEEGPVVLADCAGGLKLQQTKAKIDYFIVNAFTTFQQIHSMLADVVTMRVSCHVNHHLLCIGLGW